MRKINEKYLPKDEGTRTWLFWQHVSDLLSNYFEDTFVREQKLSFEQYMVLLTMSFTGNESTATMLSRQLERNPNTLSTILDRMEKGGLVKKTRDTVDRRLVLVTMTEKGKKKLVGAKKAGAAVIEKLTAAFKPEEIKTFLGLIKKLETVIYTDLEERDAKRKRARRLARY